ncbi:MAG TPA: hypothetical protein VK630_04140 [Reyranella sp.]|nr:hypothetical protein [Reyranella sp.]
MTMKSLLSRRSFGFGFGAAVGLAATARAQAPSTRAAILSSGAPPWVPRSGGVPAAIHADFFNGRYWGAGRATPSFESWLASLGGSFTSGPKWYQSNAAGLWTKENRSNVPVFDHDANGKRGLVIEQGTTLKGNGKRDLTHVDWVKTDCTAAKDQVGADGVAGAASSLTATGAGATCLQSITSGSVNTITAALVKRLVGVGVVEMTQDNGATWTPIVPTAAYLTFGCPFQVLVNPIVGFRLATSGDAIAVDFARVAQAGTLQMPSSPTDVDGSFDRTLDTLSIPVPCPGWSATAGSFVVELYPNSTNALGIMAASDGSNANRIQLGQNTAATQVLGTVTDGAATQANMTTAGTAGVGPGVGALYKCAMAWAANSFATVLGGSTVTADVAGTVPSAITMLRFGAVGSGITGSASFKAFSYFPFRVSNAELQRLTT